MRVRVSMSFVLTVVMLMSMGGSVGYIPGGVPEFAFVILKETAIGLIFGFVVNLILTVIIYAGEIIDYQVGIMMAKAMDPMTGVTMPVFANLYYYMFILYFFLTGGHLTYIKLFAMSYETVPVGFDFSISTINLAYVIAMFLGTVITLAVKMAMPIIAVELVMELCVGVMMKAVPTIHVFVVNIQLKVLMGLFMILAVAGPMADFIDKLLGIMWENLFRALNVLP
jgi:flagellar biosynthetic protein FliR